MNATKAQERKAIEQIATILEGLGSDSYINMAMEGVLEMAESNITNDFGNSYKALYENAQDRLTRFENLIDSPDSLANYIDKALAIEGRLADADKLIKQQADAIDRKDARIKELNDQASDAGKMIGDLIDTRHDLEAERDALRAEVTILKAKLYDLMTQ